MDNESRTIVQAPGLVAVLDAETQGAIPICPRSLDERLEQRRTNPVPTHSPLDRQG